jgi:hypothetical protein
MSKIKKIGRLFIDKSYRMSKLLEFGFYDKMPDDEYLKKMFRVRMKKELDLENPKTYNEKLQWLKLYDRKPIYTTMVDKHGAKKYVADIIGEEHIIPTIGVWDKFGDIDFDSLPEQFVLKCTHDSGGLVICKDKKKLNVSAAKKKISKSLKKNFYLRLREWPYKDVKPRIIAEKYMEDTETAELRDYKFFCFNGEAKMIFIATERQKQGEETKFDFFDMDFNLLPFTNGHPNAQVPPKKPKCFDEMRTLAEKLSKDIPHVRVDFYEVDGKVYFGEMTFFHWSGMVPFDPPEWDEKIGSWIELPAKKQ